MLATYTYGHPDITSLYAEDFSCQHVNWGYSTTSPDGENPASWATVNNRASARPQGRTRFSSHRWNVDTNQDLATASAGSDNRPPDRRLLWKFPWSRHRLPLIMLQKLKVSADSNPVKCWNFCKDDWEGFCFLTRKSVDRFPPPDTTNIEKTYQELCESLLLAAKQCIPLRRRNNYVPCWDKECKTLCHSFVRAPAGTVPDRAASSIVSRLDDKKQEGWEKAVNSIDFSHSSRWAWSTITKLKNSTSTHIVIFKWGAIVWRVSRDIIMKTALTHFSSRSS